MNSEDVFNEMTKACERKIRKEFQVSLKEAAKEKAKLIAEIADLEARVNPAHISRMESDLKKKNKDIDKRILEVEKERRQVRDASKRVIRSWNKIKILKSSRLSSLVGDGVEYGYWCAAAKEQNALRAIVRKLSHKNDSNEAKVGRKIAVKKKTRRSTR